jgi:phage terminase large subunit
VRDRYEIYYGGAGSGKSHFIAQKIIYRTLRERGHRYLIVRKVARTNRHSTYDLFRSVIASWKLQSVFKIDKTELDITFTVHGKADNQILFTGLDDVEKLKSIAGITDIWIEEASEISPEDFTQLDLRLRAKTRYPNQIILSFNPVSAYSWLKKRFFDSPVENTSILKTTYKDNRFVDDAYKQVVEGLKEQDLTYYQIYALGEWGSPKGLIYNNWRLTNEIPVSSTVTYGLDFGFNNQTALVEIREHDGEIYLRELLYQTHITNFELIEIMKSMHLTGRRIYCDSAEPNRIRELSASGFIALSAHKDVLKGIDHVKSLKLRVYAESVNLIKELQSYKWREDKDGRVLDEPVKYQDHLCDAMRYALYTGTKSEYAAW